MAHWQFHYPKRNAFYPPDYENPGLGGGEAALVLLTRQLASRGHRVEVFNCCYKPGHYDDVHWRMAWELEHAATPDVAVAVRFHEAVPPAQRRARRHLFWMLDDRPHGPAAFTRHFPKNTVVVASQAMQNRLVAADVHAPTARIPLPIETRRYRTGEERKRACLYSSMPNRGLDVLLAIWPRIRAAVPDAELWVTSGWRLWGYTHSEAEDRWRQTFGDQATPEGVKLLGPVPRAQLCHLQERAWLGLYPSRFPEMFCLAAAESGAAGTPMVTSDLDALAERVEHGRTGVLVPGAIEDPIVQDRFVAATVDLLSDPKRRDRLGAAARDQAQSYGLDAVAEQWEQLTPS